jgi:hypothetical protein
MLCFKNRDLILILKFTGGSVGRNKNGSSTSGTKLLARTMHNTPSVSLHDYHVTEIVLRTQAECADVQAGRGMLRCTARLTRGSREAQNLNGTLQGLMKTVVLDVVPLNN